MLGQYVQGVRGHLCICTQNSSICLVHKVCVTGSQRHPGQIISSITELTCTCVRAICTWMCRVCLCEQSTRSCGLQTHACVHACVGVLCVHAHVQAGLACRGCRVVVCAL